MMKRALILPVAVKGGGCSGLSYAMGFDREKQENDELFEEHGLKIIVSSEDVTNSSRNYN